jgi:hypothetical protein
VEEVFMVNKISEALESLKPSPLKNPWDSHHISQVFDFDFSETMADESRDISLNTLKSGGFFVKAIRLNLIQRLRLADVAQVDDRDSINDRRLQDRNVQMWSKFTEYITEFIATQRDIEEALHRSMKDDLGESLKVIKKKPPTLGELNGCRSCRPQTTDNGGSVDQI